MIQVWLYTFVSILIISLVSFVGVFTIGINSKKLKKILIYIISFSAGALFGDAFIHLFPEIVKNWGFGPQISIYLLAGILIFFILEKIVHFQQYHCHGDEGCEHELQESPHKSHNKKQIHSFAYMSLLGSSLHNFIDGTIIAASYIVSLPLGLATSLAVFLHEIPHEFGDFSILVHGGFNRRRALFVNFISALISLLGALFTFFLSSYVPNLQMILVPIATGGFIYVAGSDLIPELHNHNGGLRSLILQVLMFILGIIVMASLLLLE
jgi:zinc and cadmium transporter